MLLGFGFGGGGKGGGGGGLSEGWLLELKQQFSNPWNDHLRLVQITFISYFLAEVYLSSQWSVSIAHLNMDHLVQNLENAYLALISAASTVLEAKDSSDVQRTLKTDAALELFYNNLQLFHAACDQTQEFVESVRLRIGAECLVDEATGPLTAKTSKSGPDAPENRVAIPPLSALRLEQMSKAVRWLVIELQQGAMAATPRPGEQSGPLDNRPEDEANQ